MKKVMMLLALFVSLPLFAVEFEKPSFPAKTILEQPVRVPLTFERHFPFVDVKINDKGPFRFSIDTGIGGAGVIDRWTVNELGLKKVGSARARDPFATGPGIPVDVVHIDSFSIGGARFESMDMSVNEENPMGLHTNGIIGFTMFRELLATLDYPNKELRLERGSLAAGAKNVLTFRDDRVIPYVELTAGTSRMTMDIDAGSPANITLPQSMMTSLRLKSEPKVVAHARTVSAEFDILGADLDGDVQIGSLTISNPSIAFVERFTHGNLGYRFLRNYAVTFDTRNHLVAFVKPAA